MTLEEILARLEEISKELGTIADDLIKNEDALTEQQLDEKERSITSLQKEKEELEKKKNLLQAEKRNQKLANIARSGAELGNPEKDVTVRRVFRKDDEPSTDRYDTTEYRKIFMDFVCRNAMIPAEYRANEVTGVADTGAVIPTTILNEIITKLESYGEIFSLVRKLSINGGVSVPILSLKPTANWIGDKNPSDDQKIEANDNIIFNYYGVECKIAQTLLANITNIKKFTEMFVPLCVEAIIKALEIAVFKGNGTTQPTGILIDARVPAANVCTMTEKEFTSWSGWKKKVFGKMKKAYRNGIFVMAQGTFDGYIDGMVDTNGQPIARVNYGIEGGEKYRFGGKIVNTVEEDIIANYDDAAAGDVIGVFFNPKDYGINSNMQMTTTKWYDNDANEYKTKVIMICDGKLLDANGVLIIKKGATV